MRPLSRVALALSALGVVLLPTALTTDRPDRLTIDSTPAALDVPSPPAALDAPDSPAQMEGPLPAMTVLETRPWLPAYGARGDDVVVLQRWLNTQGHELVVDGVFGPRTLAAARAAGYEIAAPVVRSGSWPASFEPCGGDLPPCWVVATESGGDYNAVNWSGCGGRGCYGKWQFSGEWACKLGLPCDLLTATPEQQDEAARILFDNGRGCRNWDACP